MYLRAERTLWNLSQAKLSNLNLELQMLRNREKDILTDLETSQSSVAKLQEEIDNLSEV